MPRDLFHKGKSNPFGSETFRAISGDSSTQNLPLALTVNGTEHQPMFAYDGRDATPTDWPSVVGDNLTAIGAVSTGITTPLTDSDAKATQVTVVGGWEAATSYSPGENDLVVELLVSNVTGGFAQGSRMIVGNQRSGSGQGWNINYASTSFIRSYINNGSASNYFAACSSTPDAWSHFLIAFDRDGFSRGWQNGVYGAGQDISSVSGSLDSTKGFAIGYHNAADCMIAWVAGWSSAGLYTTIDDFGDIARRRFAMLLGVYPSVAKGAATPKAYSRSSAAYVDILRPSPVSKTDLIMVGQNWPRVTRRFRNNKTVIGYLCEPESLNSAADSDDINGADWTLSNVTRGAAIDCPVQGVDAYGIDTASADGDVEHAATFSKNPGSLQNHTMSAIVAPGNKEWVKLESVDSSSAEASQFFRLSGSGTLGIATGAVLRKGMRYLGVFGGKAWYQIYITYNGPNSAHVHKVAPCNADGDEDYVGTDGTDIYCIGVMHEYDRLVPSSLIRTSGASATRVADSGIQFEAGANVGGEDSDKLSLYAEVLCENNNNAGVLAQISDGGAAADSITLGFDATTGVGSAESAATAGNAGSVTGTTGDLDSDSAHQLQLAIQTDSLKLLVDGAEEGSEDTSVTVPDGKDELIIGADASNANQVDGIVSNVRIFKKPLTKSPNPGWS